MPREEARERIFGLLDRLRGSTDHHADRERQPHDRSRREQDGADAASPLLSVQLLDLVEISNAVVHAGSSAAESEEGSAWGSKKAQRS